MRDTSGRRWNRQPNKRELPSPRTKTKEEWEQEGYVVESFEEAMTPTTDQQRIEEAALNTCIVPDHDGEPAQDQWAYDRFKAGIEWRDKNPSPAVEGMRNQLLKLQEYFDERGAYLVEDGFEEPKECELFRENSEALQAYEKERARRSSKLKRKRQIQ